MKQSNKFPEVLGLEKYLKRINFDEDKYEVIKAREEIYGKNYLCDVTYIPKVRDRSLVLPEILEEFREGIKEASEIIPEPKNKDTGKKLIEICLFDHHFGQLSWKPEVGENYDIKIARRLALSAIDDFIEQAPENIDRILFPIGNDFFNVNSMLNTTLKGTLQSEDCRYQKTFTEGARCIIEMIDKLASLAPVDVMIVVGNHDAERSFYLGELLYAKYDNVDFVNIENRPMLRKYYQWGKVCLGFTHGDKKDKGKLPILMASEAPKMWATSKYREFHIGHLHAEKGMFLNVDDDNGIIVRTMPSLASTDDWHFGEGYVHMRKSIAILWDSERGQRAEYTYII